MASQNDNNTETGSVWAQLLRRPRQSFGGISAFVAALGMLVLNETDHKKTADALIQARDEIVMTASNAIDPALEGKLVSVRGDLLSAAGVSDPVFDVTSKAVALKRQVTMYQWLEFSYTEGSGKRAKTVYEYELGWSDVYQDSSKFKEPEGHTNPPQSLPSLVDIADDAKLGPLTFKDAELVSQALPNLDMYSDALVSDSITKSNLSELARAVQNVPELSASMRESGWQRAGSGYFKSAGSGSQDDEGSLGDLMVMFQEIPSGQELTWIGQQAGNTLKAWKSDSGKELFVLQAGHPNSKLALTEEIKADSSGLTTGRVTGLAIATFGFAAFCSALGGLLLRIPLLGKVLGAGLWLGGAIIGFVSGLAAILIGWLSARPIVAFLILAALIGLAAWRILVTGKKLEQSATLQRAADATALARQRHAERQTAGTPPPLTAIGSVSPPAALPPALLPNGALALTPSNSPAGSAAAPPPTAGSRSAFAGPAGGIPAMLPDGELPPLEWESAGSFKPPSVMTKKPSAAPEALPFDSVERRVPNAPAATEAEPSAPLKSALPPGVKAKVKRMELGEKGGFMLTKIVFIDGPSAGEIMCFELMRGKEVLTRGTQDEVKAALRTALAA